MKKDIGYMLSQELVVPIKPVDESGDSGSNINVGTYRWRICALLFFATTINYIDRQVLGILAPQLPMNCAIRSV